MRALDGTRVIDLTRVLAGPFTTMLLADLGAEVIKVETPGKGDESRGFPPFKNGVSAYFMSLNRGKHSLTLDLKHPRGKAILQQLVKCSDILVENFKPTVMDRLGLAYETLREFNPRLIYAAISGFGQTGPLAAQPAYDMIVQGMSGLMSITGVPGGEPVRVGTSIADLSAALFTTVGIVAALHAREKTGRGQMVDVAMLDSMVALLENAVTRYSVTGEAPTPLGARHPSITPFDVFRTKDSHIVIAIGNDSLWERFVDLIDAPELRRPQFASNEKRTQNQTELKARMETILLQKTTANWIEQLSAFGIPSGPINDIARVVSHPQLLARHMINICEHDKAGSFIVAGLPLKFSDMDSGLAESAPDLGQHTQETLQTLLGHSAEEVHLLRREGIV